MTNRRIINKREIPEMEKKIKELIIAEGSDETRKVEELVQRITGPAAGLIYDPNTGRLKLAEGYILDNGGNLVLLDNVNNPGAGMIYRDGKLVPAE